MRQTPRIDQHATETLYNELTDIVAVSLCCFIPLYTVRFTNYNNCYTQLHSTEDNAFDKIIDRSQAARFTAECSYFLMSIFYLKNLLDSCIFMWPITRTLPVKIDPPSYTMVCTHQNVTISCQLVCMDPRAFKPNPIYLRNHAKAWNRGKLCG